VTETIWCTLSKPGIFLTKQWEMRENVTRFVLPEKKNGPQNGPFKSQKTGIPFT
jgi:hypothetical protein